ncbi:carbonate dehydratase [Alkaliphilus pronyensis]|uniref:Carbonate dehydratase n=1 Tax=Alkaliphilus pronyensis TaxID=1482732 RepID=A0A6I0F7R2_9FIRM|nr:carbonate dehydratase [Alkaliphilus pronyensis]KAB3530680.1 carbonate dehydratase [Alkaliphilus pronyensis]
MNNIYSVGKPYSFTHNLQFQQSCSPINIYAAFIGPNPVTSFIPYAYFPSIDPSSLIGPFSTIIGAVKISSNVFIGPNTSIRADEGYPFYIGKNTNLQDGVILHGLKDERIRVKNDLYSIYIGDNVSCAHGCIVHGPCFIGDNSFIGFNSIVLNAIIEDNVYVSSDSTITNGVTVPANSFVPPGASIDTQEKANALNGVPADKEAFAKEVIRVNTEFPKSYSILLGCHTCSCGLSCDDPLCSKL